MFLAFGAFLFNVAGNYMPKVTGGEGLFAVRDHLGFSQNVIVQDS